MPQRALLVKKLPFFRAGISYRSGEIGEKLVDASNVLLINGKYTTRYGLKVFNSVSFSTNPLSLSFYLKYDGSTRKIIAKVDTTLQAAGEDGVFSTIKSGLSSSTVHNAVTMAGRHIIACGSDGLFSYNGTTFADLGVTPPSAPTTAVLAGGSLSDKTYTVALTYVSSSTGFESNIGSASNATATNSGGGNSALTVASIPTSSNALVDKINVYLKNTSDAGNNLLVKQIDNGTSTTTITANPSANAAVPPTGKDAPVAGGAKYLAIYNGQIVSAGNSSFQSDVFFSNADEPDGWSTTNTLVHAKGDGPITGLAVGNFDAHEVTQYLVIFKRHSITLYFQDITGASNDSETFIPGTGCVSHKSIRIKDGNIYFLSDFGWRVISQGRLVKDNLGKGDVDDIFNINGWVYGLNKTNISNAFSVYYSELDSYMSWVAEGASTNFDKCYNYGISSGQFMPLSFGSCTCACTGEDTNGNEVVYIGKADQNIYSYSIRNPFYDETSTGFILDVNRLDVDKLQTAGTIAIPINLVFNWFPNENYDATFNFRNLFLEAISDTSTSLSTINLQAFVNFSRSTPYAYSYNFQASEGFQLDVSMLDVGVLGDDRSRSRIVSDINLTGRNILIQIQQSVLGAHFQLLSSQLNYSRNGNFNI